MMHGLANFKYIKKIQ